MSKEEQKENWKKIKLLRRYYFFNLARKIFGLSIEF